MESVVSSPREIWFVRRDLYMADYLAAFRALGFPVRMVDRHEADLAGIRGAPPLFVVDSNLGAATYRQVTARGIPFVGLPLDQWYYSPRMRHTPAQEEVCRSLGLTLLESHLDWNFEKGASHPLLYVFTCGPEQVERYREAGARHAEFLPFGVDAGRFRPLELSPPDRARYGAPVSFIGTSLGGVENGYAKLKKTVQKIREGSRSALALSVCDRLDMMIDEMVERQVPDYGRFRMAEMVAELEKKYRLLFFYPPEMPADKETLAIQLATEVAMRQRVEAVRRLAPLGIAVWGDAAWKGLGLAGLDHRGEADWRTDLPKAINGTLVNVNVSKIMFPTGLGPRVLEVLACGGFLLSNRNPLLASLFRDGHDLVFYDDLDDLERKARHYLARPEEARRIGAQGRQAVLARHTLLHRARRIVEVLRADGLIPETAPAEARPLELLPV